jgi:hypothetical protein
MSCESQELRISWDILTFFRFQLSDLVGEIERYLGDLAVALKKPNDKSMFELSSFKTRELALRDGLLAGTVIFAGDRPIGQQTIDY